MLVGLEEASCAISGELGRQKCVVDRPGSLATTRLPGRGVVVGLLVRLHSESGASGLILAVI